MSNQTLEGITKGVETWNKAIDGVNLDYAFNETRELLRERVIGALVLLRKESIVNAGNQKREFSLPEAYIDFTDRAYDSLGTLGFAPDDILNNLPKRTKTDEEESVERWVSRIGTFTTFTTTLGGAIVGAVAAGKAGYDNLVCGACAFIGGLLGSYVSKPLIWMLGLDIKMQEVKTDGDYDFSRSIDKYILANMRYYPKT